MIDKSILGKIKKGDKITIVKMNWFGFPCALQLTVQKVYFKDYAQHRDCLWLQGKQYRKRTLKAWRVEPNEKYRIYRGWINLKELPKKTIKGINGVTIEISEIETCNYEQLKDRCPENGIIQGNF